MLTLRAGLAMALTLADVVTLPVALTITVTFTPKHRIKKVHDWRLPIFGPLPYPFVILALAPFVHSKLALLAWQKSDAVRAS
jgi:formate hydrogenlyase subunit 4